jgi:hypothetical protein
VPKQVERPAHNTKALYSPLSPALSSWPAMAAPGNHRMVGPADRLAVVAVPVDQEIVRGVRAAERASPVGRPGAVDVEAKAELPRRAVAGRGRPEGARVEAQVGRGAVVDRPADREGLPPRAAVEWPAAGALEAPLAKVALGLPLKAVEGWQAVGVRGAPLVKVALVKVAPAGRPAALKPGVADNRVAVARRVLADPPPDRA